MCADGYYNDSNNSGECTLCVNCNSDGCTSQGYCNTGCAVGYYNSGGENIDCSSCDTACTNAGCDGPDEDDCDGCDTYGSGVDQSDGKLGCIICDDECADCDFTDNCTVCKYGLYVYYPDDADDGDGLDLRLLGGAR